MKVLYLINFAGKAGTEKYVENLVDHLHPGKAECGLCYNIDGPLAEKMRARGIPTHQLEMRNPLDLKAAKQLARLCQTEGYDVIHAQYPRENYIALLAKRFGCKAKVVFTSHLIIRQSFLWNLLNRVFTPKNHKIITVCTHGRQVLESNGVAKDRIQIIYNGVDPAAAPARDRSVLQEFGIPDDAPVISILTRFSEEKGVPFLLRSIAKLKEKTTIPFRLLLVGSGPDFDRDSQLIPQLGLADTVILTGFRTDTAALLAASDIYLNSSSSEAMSFSILEALNAGLPLVVTDVGGNPELVRTGGDCGLLAPYGDEDAYADAIRTLLEDVTLREAYSAAARAKVKNEFDLHKLLDEVYQTYQ